MAFSAQLSGLIPKGIWNITFDDRDHYLREQQTLQRQQLIKAGSLLA